MNTRRAHFFAVSEKIFRALTDSEIFFVMNFDCCSASTFYNAHEAHFSKHAVAGFGFPIVYCIHSIMINDPASTFCDGWKDNESIY